MAGERSPCVAVVNSNEDVMEALRALLEEHGFETVAARVADIRRGREDLGAIVSAVRRALEHPEELSESERDPPA